MASPRPTKAAVRRLYGNRAPWGGWADFKHRLHRAGVLETAQSDVPADWKAAFKKAVGGAS